MSAPALPPEESLRDAAVAWHVRLSSDAADGDDWLAFEVWLAASPNHHEAYEAVEGLWADLDQITLAPTVLPFKQKTRRRPGAWWGAIAASLVAAVVVGATLWTSQPTTETFETAKGEPRVISLSDGTRITLNGGSRLTATLGRHERRVVMADAEAVFDVAKDPTRPFLIDAGDREIRVVGTEFNVLHHAGEVQVTVRRGIVEVRPGDAPRAPPLARLQKGQSLIHREGVPGDRILAVDPEAALAWTTGRLVFRGDRLADVARTLNRYVSIPISVAPNARDIPVTATLNLSDEDQMLQSLASFLPVQSRRIGSSIELELRRPAR